MKSMFRHMMDLWILHRGGTGTRENREDSLCAILFNIMGYLHETLKVRGYRDEISVESPAPQH